MEVGTDVYGDAAPSLAMGLVQAGSGFVFGTLIDYFMPAMKTGSELNMWQELSMFVLHVSVSAVTFGMILGPILRAQGEYDPVGGSLAIICFFMAQPSLLSRLGYLSQYMRAQVLRPITGL